MRGFAAAVATWAGDEDNSRPDPTAWHGMTWGIVEGFVKWLLNEGYAVTIIDNQLSAVKLYAKLAMKAGVISADELQLIKAVSGYSGKEAKRIDERRLVERVGEDKKEEHVSLAPADAAALKDQNLATAQGRRDALLMCLLLGLGLRVSEVAGLQVTDFNLPAGELRFYRRRWTRYKPIVSRPTPCGRPVPTLPPTRRQSGGRIWPAGKAASWSVGR